MGGSMGGSMGGGMSSRSYGGPSRSSYGGNLRNAPPMQSTTIVTPSFGFGYSPFGYGYGAPVVVGGGGGGSSLFGLLVLGIFAYVAFNAITGSRCALSAPLHLLPRCALVCGRGAAAASSSRDVQRGRLR